MINVIEMTNWNPISSLRAFFALSVSEKEPLRAMTGGNEVMYKAGYIPASMPALMTMTNVPVMIIRLSGKFIE